MITRYFAHKYESLFMYIPQTILATILAHNCPIYENASVILAQN